MNFNVRADVTAALKKLGDIPSKQVPFALALALTNTATKTQNLLTNKLPEYFDRPTPFTMRAIGIERATKTQPRARVYVKPDQLKYLQYGIDGGTRLPPKRAIPIPVDIALNTYGNLPRGKLAALLARKDVFSGTVNGIGGIWQRQANHKLVLLVSWKPKASYKKRYPFFELGGQAVKDVFPGEFRRAIEQAMRTAR